MVTKEDVDYLLRHLNRYLARPVTPKDIVSGFAGARPLVGSDESSETKTLARDDVIEVEPVSRLISIMGGKWTTHRAMAEDTIRRVQQEMGVPVTESATRHYVLDGGDGFTDDYWKRLVGKSGINGDTARHLAAKFGTKAESVLGLIGESVELAQPIVAGHPAIRAEIIYSARHEMAATIEDVLARRIGIQLYSWRSAIHAAPVVGALLGREIGWGIDFAGSAVTGYIAKINHLLISAGLPEEKADRL
jgi:glycerol-3-phosphate dehydrogenase